ncbi:MAG: cupin domain-containing protein [bacterium]
MPVIKAQDAKIFEIPNVTFHGLAAPSRGANENAVWRVVVAPGTEGAGHELSREEVLIAVSGRALARIGGVDHPVTVGDAIVVPPDTDFALSNPGEAPFEAIVVFPVGGQARVGQDSFVPPWAV